MSTFTIKNNIFAGPSTIGNSIVLIGATGGDKVVGRSLNYIEPPRAKGVFRGEVLEYRPRVTRKLEISRILDHYIPEDSVEGEVFKYVLEKYSENRKDPVIVNYLSKVVIKLFPLTPRLKIRGNGVVENFLYNSNLFFLYSQCIDNCRYKFTRSSFYIGREEKVDGIKCTFQKGEVWAISTLSVGNMGGKEKYPILDRSYTTYILAGIRNEFEDYTFGEDISIITASELVEMPHGKIYYKDYANNRDEMANHFEKSLVKVSQLEILFSDTRCRIRARVTKFLKLNV